MLRVKDHWSYLLWSDVIGQKSILELNQIVTIVSNLFFLQNVICSLNLCQFISCENFLDCGCFQVEESIPSFGYNFSLGAEKSAVTSLLQEFQFID